MISHYIIEWKSGKMQTENVAGHMELFKKMLMYLKGTFKFNIDGIHHYDENMSFIGFSKGSTNWITHSQDRTFNVFYTESIKELYLIVIYKNESIAVKLKENCFYCIPYWMTYRLSSDIDFEQKLVNLKLMTIDRPVLKSYKTVW